jgi:PTS system cellobiose-specific IIB component
VAHSISKLFDIEAFRCLKRGITPQFFILVVQLVYFPGKVDDKRFRKRLQSQLKRLLYMYIHEGVWLMTKVNILLACAGGMSSSLLMTKMQQAAKAQGIEAQIDAIGVNGVEAQMDKYQPDVILIGPQVSYVATKLQKELPVPVSVINMRDYGTMNGEKVLATAMAEIQKAQA